MEMERALVLRREDSSGQLNSSVPNSVGLSSTKISLR